MNAFEKIIKRLKEETDCPNCSMYCADADMCGFDEMRKQAIEIVNQVASEYGEEVCEWMQDDGATDIYDTKCGDSHMFIDGNPSDNKYEFCPYCGKKIKVVE